MTQTRTTDPCDPRVTPSVESLLRTGGVRLAFQPIVELKDGSLAGWEALARPQRCFRDATQLLAVARRQQQLARLDALTHALALASAPRLDRAARLFLNAAPCVIADPGFADRTDRSARLAGVGPERLVVEITELDGRVDDASLDAGVARLRQRGIGIAVDDLGAGQSDLGRVLRLRPDWMKLDRSLIENVALDPCTRTLVAALARFGAASGIRVIAEGVELPSQARVIADLGIGFAQGFWYAHPVSLREAMSPQPLQRVRRRWRAAAAVA